jgi:hypothetical protein
LAGTTLEEEGKKPKIRRRKSPKHLPKILFKFMW